MKIAADLTSLSDNLSGLERYAFCMVSEMIGLGRDKWYLIVKNEVPDAVKQLKKTYSGRVCLVHVSGGKLMVNQIKLPLVMSGIKADVYLFPSFPVPLLFGNGKKKNIYALIADTAVYDVPQTMKYRSRLLFGWGYRHSVKVCDSIITISRFSEKRIKHHFGNANNIIYAPCGIGTSNTGNSAKTSWQKVKDKYDLPEEYFLVLSTLEPRKNIGQVFKAYAEFVSHNPDAPKLVVAGRNGWMVDRELAEINETLSEHICITGFVTEEDLDAVYDHAKIFVDASLYEGFGMPPLEALSNGVAIVLVSDIPAHREVLGDDAVYFRVNDVSDLSKKMDKLYREKADRNDRPECLEKYSWEKSAGRLYEAMRSDMRLK